MMRPRTLALPGDHLPDGCLEARAIHWTPGRKAEVLARIRAGDITAGAAMRRWAISVEELDLWLAAYRKNGRAGLKVTTIQMQGKLL